MTVLNLLRVEETGGLVRLRRMARGTIFQHNRAEFFRIELADIVRGADDFAVFAIAHAGERRMEDNWNIMEPCISPDPLCKRKPIHGRHFDVA